MNSLHISNGTQEAIRIDRTGWSGIHLNSNTTGDPYWTFYMDNVVKGGIYYSRTNNDLEIKSENTNTIIQPAAGYLGIGTTTPNTKLHIGSGDVLLDNNYKLSFGDTYNYITGNTTTDSLAFVTNSNSRMTILSSGNIGIGTTNPKGLLQIGASGSFSLDGSDLNIGNNLYYSSGWKYIGATGYANLFNQEIGSGGFHFFTAGISGGVNSTAAISEKVTILNGGNVGIGATAPSDSLHVAGGIRAETMTITKTIYSDSIYANKFYGNGSGLSGVALPNTVGIDTNSADARYLSISKDTYIAEWSKVINKPTGLTGFFNDSNFISKADSISLLKNDSGFAQLSTMNDSLGLKANLINPVFTGSITADTLIINNTGLIVLKSGNVAIGDSASNAKFVVKGIGNDSSTVTVNIKNSNNTSLFYIDNAGNVGVGTTTPSVTFEVNGAIKAINTNNQVFAVFAP